jgi:hypothetical protein
MAQAVPREKAPTPNLGRPVHAGAVSVDGVSSTVELALVMADAESGVRRRTAGTDRRWSAGSLPNLRPAPRDDRAMHDATALKEDRVV